MMNAFISSHFERSSVLAGCLLLLATRSALSIGIGDLSVANDESKTPITRIEILYRLLHDEIQLPAMPSPALSGGEIDHDYILCNLALAMKNVSTKEPGLKVVIRSKFNRETNMEARQVLALALGLAGDGSVHRELIQMLKRKDRNSLRVFAAQALGNANVLVAIPDLIVALRDDWKVPPASVIGEYPVRERAALALVTMGVDVMTPDGTSLTKRGQPSWLVKEKIPDATERGDYQADKASAVRAIARELTSKDAETVVMAIEAIARVGGPAAKAELKRFIEEQERLPGKSDVVAKAKEVLFRMEADKK